MGVEVGCTDCSATSLGVFATFTFGTFESEEDSFTKRDRDSGLTSNMVIVDCGVIFRRRFNAMGYPICPRPTNP
jgi:hypothetical protein